MIMGYLTVLKICYKRDAGFRKEGHFRFWEVQEMDCSTQREFRPAQTFTPATETL
jgi:hypothetical protein